MKLRTVKIRKCKDCGERRECIWDICPYDADVNNETDPDKALWLCDDCRGLRADDI